MIEHELTFAPGEGELLFYALGFSLHELRDDNYVTRAINVIGGTEQLAAVQTSFRELIALPRPRLAAELLTRLTRSELAEKRDMLPRWSQGQLAAETILAEIRCKQTFTPAQLAHMV